MEYIILICTTLSWNWFVLYNASPQGPSHFSPIAGKLMTRHLAYSIICAKSNYLISSQWNLSMWNVATHCPQLGKNPTLCNNIDDLPSMGMQMCMRVTLQLVHDMESKVCTISSYTPIERLPVVIFSYTGYSWLHTLYIYNARVPSISFTYITFPCPPRHYKYLQNHNQ
jgi:hypothetical protein